MRRPAQELDTGPASRYVYVRDTGEPLGPTIRATHTATFVATKAGFLNPNAKPGLGEVHVIDIGAPKKLVDEYRPRAAP